MDNQCPTRDMLKRFSVGDLPEESLDKIIVHVESCTACEVVLEEFDDVDDELVADLRHLDGTEIQQAIKDDPESENNHLDFVLDIGRNFSNRVAEGSVKLDKFELLRELGSGSFGYVFLARDTELDRQVAVKIQRAGNMADSDELQRFLREARSAAQLSHPAIVSVFETGHTVEGVCYLVTEFVDGETLKNRLQKGLIDFTTAAKFTAKLADALEYAHRQDVIHRDVKSSNIIIDRDEQIHLMDFGLAKRIAAEDTVTCPGHILGTPAYMSPEQARGESEKMDERSDLYSLGVVLYEMLTGQLPFQGQHRMLLLQVLEDEPRRPSHLRSDVPRDLEVICLKTLAKRRRQRYSSAKELSDDLRRYLDGLPISARPIGHLERFGKWCRRYPLAVAAFFSLLIGSIAAILYLSNLTQYFVRQTASDSAQMQTDMLDTINAYYADIVKQIEVNLQENGQSFYNDPNANPHSNLAISAMSQIPVPARFTIELGKRLEPSDTNMQVRLYSDYPFPWRENGGPRDRFGTLAIKSLEVNPNDPVIKFTEIDGRPVVRYASARVMTESCIDCHNQHPETPKNDWRTGDVRGVLEIIRPLERDQLRTQRGLGNALLWMVIVASVLVSFCFVVFVATKSNHDKPGTS